MGLCDWLAALCEVKAEWKSASMRLGAQCVTILGELWMLVWSAEWLDSLASVSTKLSV